jgi:endonuclease/exonuclease/phosphatase family metal-dependent hydrolase
LRNLKHRFGIGLLLLVVALGLFGCGEAEKSVVPVVPVGTNPFAGATVGTDSTLEIATWNLEHFAKQNDETLTAVIQAVNAMDIDIIALQEIEDFSYFRKLRERLVSWEGDRATSAGWSINLAFLYRVDGDLQVESVYEILVEYSREFPRRPFVLEGRYKNTPIVVINNHLKCCGDGDITGEYDDEETRRRDANILLDEFIRVNYAGKNVVVVGDMNDTLTDDPTRNVFQNFLDAPDQYLFVDMDIAGGPASGWSFPGWPSHLDHIMITAPLFPAYQGASTLVQVVPLHTFMRNFNQFDSLVSDHLPVVLKLEL